MIKSLLLVFLTSLTGVIAQLSLKFGMNKIGRIGSDIINSPLATIWKIFSSPFILVAIPMYAGTFVIWTVVLSRLQLSLAYPLLAVNFVMIPLASILLLNEFVSPLQWLGISMIVVGVTLVGIGVR